MPIKIHDKDYLTVAERLDSFRNDYPEHTIKTKIVKFDESEVVIKASILDGERLLATGLAHESKADGYINATSYVENCETSAVGRALALFRYAGTEIRSAEEMQQATSQQDVNRVIEVAHAIADHAFLVHTIKHGIEMDMLADAAESWWTLPDDEKKRLWVAPSKGGAFSTKEREIMKSTEFREAYNSEQS